MRRKVVRHGITACLAAAMLSFAAAPAGAQEGTMPDWADKNGAVGLGFDKPLAGAGAEGSSGISGIYGMPAFNLQLIFAFNQESQSSGDVDMSQTEIFFVPRILFPLISKGNAVVQLVGGLGIVRESQSVGDESISVTHFLVEGGVRPEWFVTEHISFHTQVGLAIIMLGENEDAMITGGTVITFLSNANLVGNMGATFYFK